MSTTVANATNADAPEELANVPSKLLQSQDQYLLTPNYISSILPTNTLPVLNFENLVTLQDATDNAESFSSLKNVLA